MPSQHNKLTVILFFYGCLSTASLFADSNSKTKPEITSADKALQQRFQQADLVSVVRINFISELVNPAMSVQGLMAIEGHMYTGNLISEWKGDGLSNMKIRVDVADCPARLKINTDYLVFSHRLSYSKYQSYQCTDLVPMKEAADIIFELDDISELKLAKQRNIR